MNSNIKRIREKVHRLQELYWKRGKKFYYNLTLEEEEIQAFEKLNNVTLPDEYRDFIKYIGNGQGPEDCSLFAWNPNEKVENLDEPWCDPEIYNRADEKYNLPDSDEINPNPNLTPEEKAAIKASDHGTLAILDGGCGSFYFLVVTGAKRGEIWLDGNASGSGFRLRWKSFFEYYESMLDSKIKARKEDLEVRKEEREAEKEVTAALSDLKNSHQCFRAINILQYLPDKKQRKNRTAELLEKVIKAQTPFNSYESASIVQTCRKAGLHYEGIGFGEKLLLTHKDDKEILKQIKSIKSELDEDKDASELLQKIENQDKSNDAGVELKPIERKRLMALLKKDKFPSSIYKTAVRILVASERFDVDGIVYDIPKLIDKNHLDLALEFCEQVSNEKLVSEFLGNDGEENVRFNDLLSQLHYYWAVICIKKQDENGAREHYEFFKKYKGKLFLMRSVRQVPRFGLNEAIFAVNHRLSNFALDILEECKQDQDRDNSRQLWWNLKGCALVQLNKHTDALKAFEKSYSFSHWIIPCDNRCRSLIQLGRLADAEQIVNRIKSHSPLYEWCYYSSAFLELKKGNRDLAKQELLRAFELGLTRDTIDEPELIALVKEMDS